MSSKNNLGGHEITGHETVNRGEFVELFEVKSLEAFVAEPFTEEERILALERMAKQSAGRFVVPFLEPFLPFHSHRVAKNVDELFAEVTLTSLNPCPDYLRSDPANPGTSEIVEILANEDLDGYAVELGACRKHVPAAEGFLLLITTAGAYDSIYVTKAEVMSENDLPLSDRIVRTTDLVYYAYDQIDRRIEFIAIADQWLRAFAQPRRLGRDDSAHKYWRR